MMDTCHNTILTGKMLPTHYPTPKESGRLQWLQWLSVALHTALYIASQHHAAGLSRFANTDVSI